MKLLICTQAIDRTDPVLGFFHRWIEAFAQRSEKVTVIALKVGVHSLPSNVQVFSLGKEEGESRIKYLRRFYTFIVAERDNYDAVFVHMNQEYVLLGGLLWRLWGKQVWMWRNHKIGNYLTRVAVMLSHRVFCTSRASFTSQFYRNEIMPVGVDTSLFTPPQIVVPRSVLVFGRLDPVKRVKECIEVFNRLHADVVAFSATLCGDPTKGNEAYAAEVRSMAQTAAGGNIELKHGITNSEAPALYRAHSIYFNLTPSGSFDKTILEAAASGCIPVVANDMLHEILPEKLWAHESPVGALAAALVMEEGERAMLVKRLREYVEKEHSLTLLVQRILGH